VERKLRSSKMALSKMGEKRQRKWKREAWVKEGKNFFTKLPHQNNQKNDFGEAKRVKSLPEQHDSAGQNDWKIQSVLFKRKAFFFFFLVLSNKPKIHYPRNNPRT
jgi:hypothetical protein